MKLEDLKDNMEVRGIFPDEPVRVVNIKWIGKNDLELTHKNPDGSVGNLMLSRDDEHRLEISEGRHAWRFDGDGALFRLASEAQRIRLAHLFDPLLAVHTSDVEPLPHQIRAVYGCMLPRQPLRFLLADDPGAGKTIMTGLLIKELMARGDVQRCLIVCPGALVEQWQDELKHRFGLPFEILTNDQLEAAQSGNWFLENDLVLARLDKLSRDEEVQEKLDIPECYWDLVVCDEAHKMSASYFGKAGEIRYTKRYRLGELLSKLTRHFLLLTATPHNGKEEDFQLFLRLLDADRFEGRFRDGAHAVDTSDMMRRVIKEDLVKFDNTPLLPERVAHTVPYKLSGEEMHLYEQVTEYVREEFNRAEQSENGQRKGTVGFALTVLQRRLASSPEAIYQSLKRRRERLQSDLKEVEAARRRGTAVSSPGGSILDMQMVLLDDDQIEDLDDASADDVEETEESILDRATAARTMEELKAEIATLQGLEKSAHAVLRSGKDTKWNGLSELLNSAFRGGDEHAIKVGEISPVFAGAGIGPPMSSPKQKLVVFTEHRDTLRYLEKRIASVLGNPDAVVTIEGGMRREARAQAQEQFLYDPGVRVLLATDAAGEGINLQRAHLMVNYDLPWNPNRLEQRFGRIHRIGQDTVCHLWNLVAGETREGDVYHRLLEKLEAARKSLGGKVFDVLGKLQFEGRSLRDLLIEAVRYGEREDVKKRLTTQLDTQLDIESIRSALEDQALVRGVMDTRPIEEIREDMERAEARRLQPHYVESFFCAAFEKLGGKAREREPRRYQVTRVPGEIRNHKRRPGRKDPVLPQYERIAFEKDQLNSDSGPPAAFITPGHPLLGNVIDLVLAKHGDALKRGAVLVDERDNGTDPRVLFYLEHAIRDGGETRTGEARTVSRRMLYVETDKGGARRNMQYAPYLDYRPLAPGEPGVEDILKRPECEWIGPDLEEQALEYAVTHVARQHVEEVRKPRLELIEKTRAAVQQRLTKEVSYWDRRAEELKLQEKEGKPGAGLNSGEAMRRAEDLQRRLKRRQKELDLQGQLTSAPPVVLGGTLIAPLGLLLQIQGKRPETAPEQARDTQISAARAREHIMAIERGLGYNPRDVENKRLGYDIESKPSRGSGGLRMIEVKGRARGSRDVTVTRNEILTSLNNPQNYILAIVEFAEGEPPRAHYLRRPFRREPDFGASSVNYKLDELIERAGPPR